MIACMCTGLTKAQLQQAFGIDQSIDISTFNALADALQNPGGSGLSVLKVRSLLVLSPCRASAEAAKAMPKGHLYWDLLQSQVV